VEVSVVTVPAVTLPAETANAVVVALGVGIELARGAHAPAIASIAAINQVTMPLRVLRSHMSLAIPFTSWPPQPFRATRKAHSPFSLYRNRSPTVSD
jgi:hypothetical protein